MIRISKTSKLDGINSWSLEAGATCPGANNASVCNGCYAKQGNYRYPNVKAPRFENKKDWKRTDWVDDMAKALDNQRYFRWFDSGDMYKPELARKILEVCKRTPWVNHWIPTQSWDIPSFDAVFAELHDLPNVALRASAKHVDAPVDYKLSSVVLSGHKSIDGVKVCGAYQHDGKCNGCRACWDKSIQTIGYPAHGRSMAKHIALKVVA